MVWYFIWPAPHPKYVHPPGTTIIFLHLRVFRDFGQNFSRPPVCLTSAYTGPTFSERSTKYLKCLLMQFSTKKIFENFTPKSKGKSGRRVILGRFFKRKKIFLGRNWTSSKHHRRCLEVQRTCLKRFLTSEGHVDQMRLCGRRLAKIGFFWSEISGGCAYVCKYFLVGCAAQKGPKGSYLRGKSCPTSLRYLVLKKINFE